MPSPVPCRSRIEPDRRLRKAAFSARKLSASGAASHLLTQSTASTLCISAITRNLSISAKFGFRSCRRADDQKDVHIDDRRADKLIFSRQNLIDYALVSRPHQGCRDLHSPRQQASYRLFRKIPLPFASIRPALAPCLHIVEAADSFIICPVISSVFFMLRHQLPDPRHRQRRPFRFRFRQAARPADLILYLGSLFQLCALRILLPKKTRFCAISVVSSKTGTAAASPAFASSALASSGVLPIIFGILTISLAVADLDLNHRCRPARTDPLRSTAR